MSDALPSIVEVFVDGACSGNPGPGGWGAILRWRDHERELSGSAPGTTNNRMELTAAIEGLNALRRPATVHVTTDSTIRAMRMVIAAFICSENGVRSGVSM